MKTRISLLLLSILLISNANGQISWGTPGEIATSNFGNDQPRIVMDASGNSLVLWSSSGDAMFSKWNGTGFTTPVAVNPSSISVAGASWMGPNIHSHGDTVYVVFKETPENLSTSGIWCTRSFDAGANFSTPVRVDNIGADISRFPTVTTDDLGNPIVAFMRYNSSFANPEWVVTKSVDFGSSFSLDTIASGWSSATAEVCDCCPGVVASSGNKVAMLYRDNNSNIRDTWVGVSSNSGTSFSGGMNVDQQNWLIMSCPSDGPDGIIIGDTVYSIFMSGGGGNYRTYYNKNSLSTVTGSNGIAVTGSLPGLTQQNYPHIANSGNAVAMVWRQVISGTVQLALKFTNNIGAGLPTPYDTVATGNVTNSDLEIQDGNIMVVWQDNISGTIKYRSGSYLATGIENIDKNENISVYPNPTSSSFSIVGLNTPFNISIYNSVGQRLYTENNILDSSNSIDLSHFKSGLLLIRIESKGEVFYSKIMKQ